jgi:hypothetical protein
VRFELHIEEWRAGAGVDTVEEDDAGVCKYAPGGVHINDTVEKDDAGVCKYAPGGVHIKEG